MANISYFTKSGTEYTLNQDGTLSRDGELFPKEDGPKYTYAGIFDHPAAKEIVDSDSISATRGEWSIQHLLYVLKSEGRLPKLEEVPFNDVKNYIDGKMALGCINHELEELIWTTPIARHEEK